VPLPEVTFKEPLPDGPTEGERASYRIANLSPAQCRAELARRKLPVTREGRATPGVATPLRLTGEVRGIRFITPGKRSVYGIFDCRLVVLLDELAEVLSREGVTAVHVDNAYRPKARLPGRRKKKSQHAYGLAIDLYGFTLKDGTELVVERDFGGSLRAPVCGPLATAPDDAKAIAVRNLTCAIARSRLFNYLLTPNFDAAHADHLHADIQRGTRARVVK